MRGLQVSLNGEVLYVIGVGDFGSMNTGVEWGRTATNKGPIIEHLWVGARGYVGKPLKDYHWQNHALSVGDEVTIKVVDIETPDDPLPSLPNFPWTEN